MLNSYKTVFTSKAQGASDSSEPTFFGPSDLDGDQSKEDMLAVCSTCQQVFNAAQISLHLVKCKGTYVCEICKSTFSQKEYLQKHIRRKHHKVTSSENQHVCQDCGKTCSSKNSLLVHQRTHTGYLPYQCSVCGLKFAQLNNFQIHVDLWHSNIELKDSEDKQYGCEICDKSFLYVAGLKYHMKEHFKVIVKETELRHLCDKCDKKFQFKSQLDRHLLSHLTRDQYEHQCKICFKKFNQSRLLSAHILDHKDPSLARCPCCSRTFSSRAYLQKHLSSHSKTKSLSKNLSDFENAFDFNKSLPRLEVLNDIQFNENLLISHIDFQGENELHEELEPEKTETLQAIESILKKEPKEMNSLDHEVVADIFRQINDNCCEIDLKQ